MLTSRSQQFHPWYLSWSLVWLPVIKNKVWRNTLLLFSISSLVRYLPWMLENGYNPQILLKQKLITWIQLALTLFSYRFQLSFFQAYIQAHRKKSISHSIMTSCRKCLIG